MSGGPLPPGDPQPQGPPLTRTPTRRVLIPDAGVGVMWYVPQGHTDAALRFLEGDYDLRVPDYFFTEAASTLQQYAALRGLLTEAEGLAVLRRLRRVPMTVYDTAGLLEDAYRLAVRYRRPVYDSLYLALAAAVGGRVVTADGRLHRGVAGGPLGDLVLWVADPL